MITYKGGSGKGSDDAIIILGAKNEFDGIEAEYIWLEEKYGEQNNSWDLIDQECVINGNNKFDILRIKFPGSEERELWFDITDFYGK